MQKLSEGRSPLATAVSICAQFILYLLFVLTILRPTGPPAGAQLDPSYRQAYAHFLHEGAQIGADYIFTLGPLGHFLVPQFHEGLYWIDYAVALLLALLAAYPLYRVTLIIRPRVIAPVFVALAVLYIPRSGPESGFVVAMLAMTALIAHGTVRHYVPLMLYCVALGFLSLCKFNLMLLAPVCLGYVSLSLMLERSFRSALVAPIVFLASMGVFWLAARQHPAHIVPYVAGSLELSRMYSASMALLGGSRVAILLGGVAALSCMAAVISGRSATNSRWTPVLASLFCAGVLALAWKMGYARQGGHEVKFLAPCLFLPFFMAAVRVRKRSWEAIRIGAILLTVGAALGAYYAAASVSPVGAVNSSVKRAQTKAGAILFPRARAETLQNAQARLEAKHALPQTQIIVGDATIDIFPPEQGVLFLNRLNYQPRCVFQGYGAGTPKLLEANGASYSGAAGRRPPMYVLFDLRPIDGRFPAMNDSQALLALLSHYQPVLQEGGYLLYQRMAGTALELDRRQIDQGTMRVGDWLPIPDDASRWHLISIDLPLSVVGSIEQLLHHAPVLLLNVKISNGQIRTYRIAHTITTTPFVVSPLLERNSALLGFVGGRPAPAVEAVMLVVEPGGESRYATSASYRLYSMPPPASVRTQYEVEALEGDSR